jgi:hypothetical protein
VGADSYCHGLSRAGDSGSACLPAWGVLRAGGAGGDCSRQFGMSRVRAGAISIDHGASCLLLAGSDLFPRAPGFRTSEVVLAWPAVGYASSAGLLRPSVPELQ